MTKADLVGVEGEGGPLFKAAAERALNGIIGIMFKALSKGDKIKLAGFGTFAVKKQAAPASAATADRQAHQDLGPQGRQVHRGQEAEEGRELVASGLLFG